ncbi:MAG: YdeI/OmpD-associated family protein [Saprospiraceae bacterium]|nr:YdeI/OmpD-associated family protein [Saprospiraceae bacterium]
MEIYRNHITYAPSDRSSWRQWLSDNWDKETSVFLIIYKKDSGIPSISYDEAVDEALCYGWVDSKINKRDERSWYQYFAKRNPKSNWSRVNKVKIEKLIKANLMSKPGLDMVDKAQKTGSWTALDDVENLILPLEMDIIFQKNPIAFGYWEQFPRSVKRGILEWIFNAKKPETKTARIQKTVQMAAENKRANFE